MSFSPEANLDRHWCDPDTYRVTYSSRAPTQFSYTWDVSGPRKDLLLIVGAEAAGVNRLGSNP